MWYDATLIEMHGKNNSTLFHLFIKYIPKKWVKSVLEWVDLAGKNSNKSSIATSETKLLLLQTKEKDISNSRTKTLNNKHLHFMGTICHRAPRWDAYFSWDSSVQGSNVSRVQICSGSKYVQGPNMSGPKCVAAQYK